MAVVTAAVIGAAATVGTTAYAMSQQPSGGGASNPTYRPGPSDPIDRSMRSYFARSTLANAENQYPAYNDYLASGGDPAKARFDLQMPGMTPGEATGLGFIGKRGETIPGLDQAAVTSGDIKNLSPEQILYLAKEKRRRAAAMGTESPWASKVVRTSNQLGRVEDKLAGVAAITDPSRVQAQRAENLTARRDRLNARQNKYLYPDNQ